ncbi:MAG TPA: hypothetical protein VLE20_12515 [Blastocatellia bacterium]|jgi:hypothetical protein|nr:hypothetical protein [Blastocatellia bacterium]
MNNHDDRETNNQQSLIEGFTIDEAQAEAVKIGTIVIKAVRLSPGENLPEPS